MTRTAQTNLTDSGLSRTIIVGTHLLSVVVFLCLAPVLVSAQSMGSSATYSDMWLDNSTGTLSVKGSGVTQDYNNTYNHSYWVVAKLTAPDSSTFSTTTSYSSSSYARAETSLLADNGDFNLRTEHWMRCPYMGGSGFPGTIIGLIRTIVLSAYKREEPSGEYVPTCCSPCSITPRYIPVGVNTPYAQCGQFYDATNPNGACSIGLCSNQNTPGRCNPNTGRQPPNC